MYSKGEFVLVYNQEHDNLGARKFEPMSHDPYIHYKKKGHW